MSVILPKHINLSIEHNPHKIYYESIDTHIQKYDTLDWISGDDYLISCEKDELWVLQWYPNTPVGSCVKYASSFTVLMEIIAKELQHSLMEYD